MDALLFDLNGTITFTSLFSSVGASPTAEDVWLCPEQLEPFLSASVRLGVATASPLEEAREVLRIANLTDLFDEALFLTLENGGGSKSSGEGLARVAAQVDGRIVFIGDQETDRLGAERAGIAFVRTDATKEGLHAALQKAEAFLL